MRRYNIFYFIGEAFKSLYRNGVMTFASIAVLLSCLLVIGGFSLLVANINVNLEKLDNVNNIVVFCNPDASDEEVESVKNTISKLDNVGKIDHATKEDLLEELKEMDPTLYGDITAEENPLSDSITITYKDSEKVFELTDSLKRLQDDGKILKFRDNPKLSSTISDFKNAITLIFIWFLAILFVVSIFIIINTIKIAVLNRKKEITIMRYIGASAWFIALPFIFEGMIMGLAAGTIAFIIIQFGYSGVVNVFTSNLQMISVIKLSDVSGYILAGALSIGVFTGVSGSFISLGKYLKE